MDKKASYASARATLIVTVLGFLAPITGVILEMSLAWRFGASATMDALRVSLLILVLALQLLFGSLLPNIAIPIISDLKSRGREVDAWRFAFTVGTFLMLGSMLFVAVTFYETGIFVKLLGPGLIGQAYSDAIILIRCFGIVCFMMVWSGIFSSLLNVYRVFWLTVVVRVIPNIFIVIAILIMGRYFTVTSLAYNYLAAYSVIFLLFTVAIVLLARVSNVSLSQACRFGPKKESWRAFKGALPIALMILVSLSTDIVINRELSEMPEGTVSVFGYSWKLLALMSLLPGGLLLVIFPSLADAFSRNDEIDFQRLVMRLLRYTLLLSIPLATFVASQSTVIVDILLGRGEMDLQSMSLVSSYLQILLVGAPGASLLAVLTKVSFARNDLYLPTIVTSLTALLGVLLVPYFANMGGAKAVAWTISGVAWFGYIALFLLQKVRYRFQHSLEPFVYLAKIIILSGILAAIMNGVNATWGIDSSVNSYLAFGSLALKSLIYAFFGFFVCRILGINESTEVVDFMKWQVSHYLNKSKN